MARRDTSPLGHLTARLVTDAHAFQLGYTEYSAMVARWGRCESGGKARVREVA